jgi:hypothetical protein
LFAPIAIFAFNRPDKLANCLESLSKNLGASSSDLFIFVDGPRKPDDIPKVDAVTTISLGAKGFRSVTVERSEVNFGLAKSIKQGIDKVLRDFDSIIVIEDDLILAETFLEYMNAGLSKYISNKSFASIQGFQYPISPPMEELVTIRGADCWGWATWKDRWDLTIFDSKRMLSDLKSQNLEYEFDLDGSMPYTKMLENQSLGLIDSWAICWHASMFLSGKVSLHPRESLVFNSGNDGKGTHKNRSSMFDTKLGKWDIPDVWPPAEENQVYRNRLISFYRFSFGAKPPAYSRLLERAKLILGKVLHSRA